MQKLRQSKLIDEVGGIISLKDKSSAKVALNEFLDKDKIDLDKIISLFL